MTTAGKSTESSTPSKAVEKRSPIIFELEYERAFAQSAAGLIVDAESGEILYATHSLESMFGYTFKGELGGKSVDLLVPENVRDKHPQYRSRYAADPDSRPAGIGLLLTGQRKNGTTFSVSVGLSAQVLARRRVVIANVLEMTTAGVMST